MLNIIATNEVLVRQRWLVSYISWLPSVTRCGLVRLAAINVYKKFMINLPS